MSTTIKFVSVAVVLAILFILSVVSWFIDLFYHLGTNNITWVIVDIFLWPVGIVHGFGHWFHWWI